MARFEPLARAFQYLTGRQKNRTAPSPGDFKPRWNYSGLGYPSTTIGQNWFGKEHEEEAKDIGPKLIGVLASAVSDRYPAAKEKLERLAVQNTSLDYLIPTGNIQRAVEDLEGVEWHLINAGSACGFGPLYVAAHLPVDVDGFDGDVYGLFMGERLKQNPLILPSYEATNYCRTGYSHINYQALADIIDASAPYLRLKETGSLHADSLAAVLQEVFSRHNIDVDAIKKTRFSRDPSVLYGTEVAKRMLRSRDRVRLGLGLAETPNIVVGIDGEVRELPEGYYDGGWDLEFWQRLDETGQEEVKRQAIERFNKMLKPDARYLRAY